MQGVLRTPEDAGTNWLDGHLDESTAVLLDAAWIFSTRCCMATRKEPSRPTTRRGRVDRRTATMHMYLMAGPPLGVGVDN